MSLGNWMPAHCSQTCNELTSAAHASHTPHVGSAQSVPQHSTAAVASMQRPASLLQGHLQSVLPSSLPGQLPAVMTMRHQQSNEQGQQTERRLHARSVKNAANQRRRKCLLEIERELLRHSSSDEEQGNELQLPKRQRTACTGTPCTCHC